MVGVPGYSSVGPGFDSRRYQIFWEVVGLEWGPRSLVSTIEEPLERNNSGSGLENGEYGRGVPLHWPRDTVYPQKLALTSSTSGGCSAGIVCLRAKAMEFSFINHYSSYVYFSKCSTHPIVLTYKQIYGVIQFMSFHFPASKLKTERWIYMKYNVICLYGCKTWPFLLSVLQTCNGIYPIGFSYRLPDILAGLYEFLQTTNECRNSTQIYNTSWLPPSESLLTYNSRSPFHLIRVSSLFLVSWGWGWYVGY
jgi:hypothetical protein